MPAFVSPRARLALRAASLAVIAIGMAGCSDSGRFDVDNPFSTSSRPMPRQDVTGSVARPAPSTRVASQPLPAPSRPQPVYGGTYHASTPSREVTGSVTTAPAAQSGHWTWEGGTPVVVGRDDTVEIIGRRYGVPASAIRQANGLTEASRLQPGQRLVIPRYTVSAVAAPAPQLAPARVASAQSAQPARQELVHTVAPGESLIGISRKYGVSLKALAAANKIQPYTKVNMGDRLTIPGHHAEAVKTAHAPETKAPQQAAAHPAKPVTHVASAAPTAQAPQAPAVATVPATETARLAKPEAPPTEAPAKAAEPTGSMPSFRWPVHGRVISSFGTKPNGAQNDGINVAVPEGTPIKAADDGVVAYAGNELKGYGNLVLIRHSNGYVSAYANASALLVKRGDTVKRGETIARAGQTGNVDSPQLHFEIRKGSTPVDPTRFLAQNN
jgi:murein DD-endopeptidase MepM/ murein hydrolase activator NlpD